MGPLSHAALAYLVWTTYTRARARRPPTDAEFWLVLLASQLPDLVDKPLAWTVSVLPAGRSLGHSLLTIGVLTLLLKRVLPRKRANVAVAVGLTMWGHALFDAVAPLHRGQTAYIRYLLWPLIEQPPYDTSRSVLLVASESLRYGISVTHVLILGVIATVWLIDGMPGFSRPSVSSE